MLQPTHQQSEQQSQNGAANAYYPAFVDENALYSFSVEAEAVQCCNIVLLVDYQHRERAYHIEAANNQYKCENQKYSELLRLHHLVEHLVLLVLRADNIVVANHCRNFVAGAVTVGAGLQFQLKRAHLCRVVEQVAGKVDRYKHVAVVNLLLNGEYSRREDVRVAECALRIHRYAPVAFGNIDANRTYKIHINRQIISQSGT